MCILYFLYRPGSVDFQIMIKLPQVLRVDGDMVHCVRPEGIRIHAQHQEGAGGQNEKMCQHVRDVVLLIQ